MFKTLRNAWNQPELRRKLLVTAIILILYRLGTAIPVPYFAAAPDSDVWTGNILEFFNILSGGALAQGTLLCLGVSPYITSSIVMQLLTVAIPKLGEKAKQGEEGKKFVNFWTRIITVILAVITALGYALTAFRQGWTVWGTAEVDTWVQVWAISIMVICYCAGASIVMWLAEKINESGIGNGISMILFAGIITSIPSAVTQLWNTTFAGGDITKFQLGGFFLVLGVILGVVGLLFLIVWMSDGERRIPIQYAKRVVGRKMYGGQNTNLPIKVNMSGVMPIIFASSIASLPATFAAFFPNVGWLTWIAENFSYDTWIYVVINLILIVAFSYFYVMISFNPVEVANNIKDNGGSIPGIRPGRPTSDYIQKVLNRITTIGAVFLCFISCFPMIVTIIAGYFNWQISGIAQIAFGGTSILIVIGVALETVRELEAQMTLRNYKGFLD